MTPTIIDKVPVFTFPANTPAEQIMAALPEIHAFACGYTRTPVYSTQRSKIVIEAEGKNKEILVNPHANLASLQEKAEVTLGIKKDMKTRVMSTSQEVGVAV